MVRRVAATMSLIVVAMVTGCKKEPSLHAKQFAAFKDKLQAIGPVNITNDLTVKDLNYLLLDSTSNKPVLLIGFKDLYSAIWLDGCVLGFKPDVITVRYPNHQASAYWKVTLNGNALSQEVQCRDSGRLLGYLRGCPKERDVSGCGPLPPFYYGERE